MSMGLISVEQESSLTSEVNFQRNGRKNGKGRRVEFRFILTVCMTQLISDEIPM